MEQVEQLMELCQEDDMAEVRARLELADAALDTAEATADESLRRMSISMSRKAHTILIRQLSAMKHDDVEHAAFQLLLRRLEVRLQSFRG